MYAIELPPCSICMLRMDVIGNGVVIQAMEIDQRKGRIQGYITEPNEGTRNVGSHARDNVIELRRCHVGEQTSVGVPTHMNAFHVEAVVCTDIVHQLSVWLFSGVVRFHGSKVNPL